MRDKVYFGLAAAFLVAAIVTWLTGHPEPSIVCCVAGAFFAGGPALR